MHVTQGGKGEGVMMVDMQPYRKKLGIGRKVTDKHISVVAPSQYLIAAGRGRATIFR